MKRVLSVYALLIALLAILAVISTCSGTVSASVGELFNAIFSPDMNESLTLIIWDIRLPRTIAAIFLGGALALSGYILQAFFRNPIAGPYVLGISAGAKLFVAILMIVSFGLNTAVSSFMMVVSAFLGALFSMALVLAAALKVKDMAVLVVCGVMTSYICSSLTDLAISFADDSDIVNLHNWSRGSFSGLGMGDAKVYIPVILAALVIAFLASKTLLVYSMGEDYCKSLGVNIFAFRILLILLTSILSATVTAYAGAVSFVGIAVPHVIRVLTKSEKPLYVIPLSFLGGAIFCLLCDILSRTLFAPTELSISTMTAVFGAPIVIWMLLKRRKRS